MSHELMSLPLQVFSVATLIALLAWVVHLIRTQRLNLRDSLLWLLSTASALVAAVFPVTLRWIATALGISVPSNAIFALAFVYVLVNLLAATLAISRNAARLRRLIQECTLLRAELDVLRARMERVERHDR